MVRTTTSMTRIPASRRVHRHTCSFLLSIPPPRPARAYFCPLPPLNSIPLLLYLYAHRWLKYNMFLPSALSKQQPELLTRFIPADPWVGRVFLSSPQPPGGSSSAAAALAAKHGGGSGGASSTASPNGLNTDNAAINNGNGVGSSAIGASTNSGNHQGKGVVGLRNEGNWCYLNASLQALARCAPFRAHLLECVRSPDVAGRPW